MRKHVIKLLVVLSIFTTPLLAQGILTFDDKKVDVGEVYEKDSVAVFKFKFLNTGKGTLLVQDVKTSCGCLTAVWPKEQIEPGESGEVFVSYQTWNRPGPFDRDISVSTNGTPSVVKLEFAGMVLPKSKGVNYDFPVELGGMRVETTQLSIGNVTNEKLLTRSFKVYNQGTGDLKILKKNVPKHIDVSFLNGKVLPNSEGELVITYDPIIKADLGYSKDVIEITTNDTVASKSFFIYASILEYFSDTIDPISAPRLLLDKSAQDFGTLKLSVPDSTIFKLTNAGKRNLIVREIEFDKNIMTCKMAKDTIAAGETTDLFVKLIGATTGTGRKTNAIILYVNDPKAPRHSIKITSKFE